MTVIGNVCISKFYFNTQSYKPNLYKPHRIGNSFLYRPIYKRNNKYFWWDSEPA